MTDTFAPDEERDLLAAEYVLGLLEGQALMDARGRAAGDPAFAAAVADWEARLAPMADGFAEIAPAPYMWERIERALDAQAAAGGGSGGGGGGSGGENVARLERRERLWRNWSIGMTALAAGLALTLGLRIAQPDAPAPAAPAEQRATALFASLASEDGTAALAIAFEPDRGTMVVTPARLQGAANHDHELWLIAGEGAAPVSLGLVRGSEPKRVPISAALRAAVAADATVALSVEPAGGSPTGSPTGPVIASGPLRRV